MIANDNRDDQRDSPDRPEDVGERMRWRRQAVSTKETKGQALLAIVRRNTLDYQCGVGSAAANSSHDPKRLSAGPWPKLSPALGKKAASENSMASHAGWYRCKHEDNAGVVGGGRRF
jgi:hypothetical protein